MVKVIIFSDIKIYCEGLSRILSQNRPLEVVAAENNFVDAIHAVEQISPHIVLLDMTMKHSSQMAKELLQSFPEVKVVALAVPEDEQNIFECAQAGIAGYVARESSLDELIETVLCAARGEFRCSARIAACMFNKIHHGEQKSDAFEQRDLQPIFSPGTDVEADPVSALTRREQQITRLMANGLSNKEISNTLFIEVSTVKNHVHNILVKLKVHSRAQVMRLLQPPVNVPESRSSDSGILASASF